MRRLTFICCALLFVVSVSADGLRSDVLLTDSGVFFRIDSVPVTEYNDGHPDATVDVASQLILVLTVQGEDGDEQIPVPASLTGGSNIEPSLAYDPVDERVYLFWQRKPSPSSSELMLTSYKDGVWSNETTFDNGIWRLRFNLRIGITHFMTIVDDEGNTIREKATVAHAVWWEQHGQHESARYAMLSLSGGDVTGLVIRDMSELSSLTESLEVRELPEDYDKSIFRTPYILDVPDNDSVDILFADWYTNHFEIVNVRPILDEKNGVLHVPTGVTTSVLDAPRIRARDVNNLTAMSTTSGGATDILIYSMDTDTVEYVIYRDGQWTTSRSINLRGGTTSSEVVEALRRNLSRK